MREHSSRKDGPKHHISLGLGGIKGGVESQAGRPDASPRRRRGQSKLIMSAMRLCRPCQAFLEYSNHLAVYTNTGRWLGIACEGPIDHTFITNLNVG
jgi:hypothetical protein